MTERGSVSELFAPGDLPWDPKGLADLAALHPGSSQWESTPTYPQWLPISPPATPQPPSEADIWALMKKVADASGYQKQIEKLQIPCLQCGSYSCPGAPDKKGLCTGKIWKPKP